ncbi:hypothetical protein KEJ13_07810 [Candidatus Bathyarchaeota archaeon]|nr:hypothetical protein [Candidatus Bathyarchaeota archaeon]
MYSRISRIHINLPNETGRWGPLRPTDRRNLYNIHILAAILACVPIYALYSITIHASLTAIIYAWRTAIHLHAADRALRM